MEAMRDEIYRKLGDRYPPLIITGLGLPLDLAEASVTYTFIPDSKRAQRRHGVPLRVLDPARGIVEAPRPRTTGMCAITIRFGDECQTLDSLIRVVR